MTFLMTYTFLRTLTRGNHCACLVEAVGIQQLAVHLIVVPEYARGLEYVQGRLSRVLKPGRYAVWT